MSTDAIVLLKTDHKDIREQFRRFRQAGENAAAAKGRIVEKIIELLTMHTYLENQDVRGENCDRTWRTTCWSPTRNTMSPICWSPSWPR